MDAYRVDVKPLLDTLGASVVVSTDIELSELAVGPEVFVLTGPVRADVTLSNTGAGVIAYGTVSAPARVDCVRCLQPFEVELAGEVEGFYVHQGRDTDLPEEQDVEYLTSDGEVDIMPAIVSALAVDAPFAPLHDPECAGLCPVCGCDRNTESCSCHEGLDAANPFAALKGLVAEDAEDPNAP